MKWLEVLQARYELLPIKLRLFIGMLIAANTAGTAIYLGFKFCGTESDYRACLGGFLMLRVVLFMANPSLPLTDKNVAFMSSERALWNVMTLIILATMHPVLTLLAKLS
jgi:hypothetical protein